MKRLPLLLTLALLASVPAGAPQCDVTATPVVFGFYNPLSPVPLDTTGAINVTCQTPAQNPQTVTIQVTAGGSGNFAQRSMAPVAAVGRPSSATSTSPPRWPLCSVTATAVRPS